MRRFLSPTSVIAIVAFLNLAYVVWRDYQKPISPNEIIETYTPEYVEVPVERKTLHIPWISDEESEEKTYIAQEHHRFIVIEKRWVCPVGEWFCLDVPELQKSGALEEIYKMFLYLK